MRRGSIASLVGIGVVAGGIAAAVALALPWLPTPASREAGRIDFIFWFTVTICIVIFALVVAVILYAVTHFRAAPDDDSDGPPIHGHTGAGTSILATPRVPRYRLGAFDVICAELCGSGHATMRWTAVVMTPAAFDKWLNGQTKAIGSPNPGQAGAAVFKNNGCGACHAFAA